MRPTRYKKEKAVKPKPPKFRGRRPNSGWKPLPEGLTSKRCGGRSYKGCGEMKPFSDFDKNPQARDGYHTYCKICRQKEGVIWRDANRDKIAQYNRLHYKRIKEKKA